MVSFEPKGEALELLVLNIERNQLSSRITVNPVALGTKAGRGRLHLMAGNLGASHVEVSDVSAPSTDHVRNWAQVAALVRSPLALRVLTKRAIGRSVRPVRHRFRRPLISPLGEHE